MNGVLAVRALGKEEGAALQNWRLGHVPAGSTDAVAYSLNGTRSPGAAALHIALGDRSFPHLVPLQYLLGVSCPCPYQPVGGSGGQLNCKIMVLKGSQRRV